MEKKLFDYMDNSVSEIYCDYTADSNLLRLELSKLLKPEDRIDSLRLKKVQNPPQANHPNRQITITFFRKD